MNSENKRTEILSSFLWKFAERISAQVVTFIVSLILARLLEPEDYGMVSIVMIFITLANIFVNDGFASALVQKQNADLIDFSSVFFFNIAFSVVLYIVLFVAAPSIQKFYGDGYEVITPVLRVLGVRLILSAINSIQQAYVSKKMMFRMFFLSTLAGTIVSAFVGIYLAYKGFGVWALVAQYLTNTMIGTVVLAFRIKKCPVFIISFKRIRSLFTYGMNILGASLLVGGFTQVKSLLIGKLYSANDLAYYDRAYQFPNVFVSNIDTSIGAVLFPELSRKQNDISKVKDIIRNSIKLSSFFICPLMVGLAVVAEQLVQFLLTDKWLPCVPLLQMFCIYFMVQPIHTSNMQAIKALGRSDIFIKLEIIKKTIEIITLLVFLKYGVNVIVFSMMILNIVFVFVNFSPNTKLLSYKYTELFEDFIPSLINSLIMGGVVFSLEFIFDFPNIITLITQISTGIFIYFFFAKVTKRPELEFFLNLLKIKNAG